MPNYRVYLSRLPSGSLARGSDRGLNCERGVGCWDGSVVERAIENAAERGRGIIGGDANVDISAIDAHVFYDEIGPHNHRCAAASHWFVHTHNYIVPYVTQDK